MRGILRLAKEHYLFTTDKGLFEINGDEVSHFSKDVNNNDVEMRVIKQAKSGKIIIGALDGVYIFDNKKLTKVFPNSGNE